MATKQIMITLQSQPTAAENVLLNVGVDSITTFNQTVSPTGPIQLDTSDPLESITFDLDMAESGNLYVTQNRTFSVTVSNGNAKIRNILCNFTAWGNTTGNVTTFVPGTANNFVICAIASQPLWNGRELLDRYNIADTPGAGEVYIAAGETVVFDVPVWLFNNSAP
jgi:hypothetical protein